MLSTFNFLAKKNDTKKLSVENRKTLRNLEQSLECLQEKNRAHVQKIWEADRELCKPNISGTEKQKLEELIGLLQKLIEDERLLTRINEVQTEISNLVGKPTSSSYSQNAPAFTC